MEETHYSTNKRIPTLSEVRRKEREDRDTTLDNDALILLEKSVKFYKRKYPKSELNYVWNEPKIKFTIIKGLELKEFLERCTETQLLEIKLIFLYCHDERFIKTVKAHDKMNRVNAYIKHMIPGGRYIDRLIRLRKDNEVMTFEIKDLEQKLEKERAEFQKKFGVKERLICSKCEKIYKSPAGLKAHIEKCQGEQE